MFHKPVTHHGRPLITSVFLCYYNGKIDLFIYRTVCVLASQRDLDESRREVNDFIVI